MVRQLSNESSLDNLKREAKRWLKALRENDVAARERLLRAVPTPTDNPTLRDVQHALACEHGFDGWISMSTAVERIRTIRNSDAQSNDAVDPELGEFLLASSKGDVASVKDMLARRSDLLDLRGALPGHVGRRTALHFGVGSPNKIEMARVLLDAGANPNIRDDGDNAFPLHFVAENREMEIVRMLLDHGADTDGEGDYHELGVMGWATVFGNDNLDVARELLSRGAVHTLPSAIVMGDVVAMRSLIDENPERLGMKLDSANRHRTLLHLAVFKNQMAALDVLIESGINLNATDVAGLTALDQAAMDGKTGFAERLIDAGATVELPTAIVLERTADIERLLSSDPQLLKSGQRYGQLIVLASERAPATVIQTLLKYGADVNARALEEAAVDNTTGYTALHAAAFHGNLPAVDVLLKAGANPRAREDKYCSAPAGWAHHGKHATALARILQEDVDIFDAAAFNLVDQVKKIVSRDPGALRRRFGEYVRCVPTPEMPWKNPNKRPLDDANDWGSAEAAALLTELLEQTQVTHDEIVSRFLLNASPDWRLTSGMDIGVAMHTASRLLRQHPEISRENIFTAVVCGDVARVREFLAEDSQSASRADVDRGWTPLLMLSTARLVQSESAENAVEIARLLLEHGADPNAYCPGGIELIGYDEGDAHFTVLTNIIGRGEGRVPAHPRMLELATLLLERGANPYDKQVLYNVFAGHSSRADLKRDSTWLLDLMYDTAVRAGRANDWTDPEWKMLDLGTFGPGANTVLEATVETNNLALTAWALDHGASANVRSYNPRAARTSLMDRAIRNGNRVMQDLLLHHGANPAEVTASSEYEQFMGACLSGDRVNATERMAKHPEWRAVPFALTTATLQDNDEAVRLLLELGVSPDLHMDGQQSRALHFAAFRGSIAVAKVLLEAGANPDPRETSYDSTPLGTAAWAQQSSMVELLVNYSRDLFNLVLVGNVERVQKVLGEDPSAARRTLRNGDTMLMRLPENEDDALVIAELLLRNGADPLVRNGKGLTAADLAERRSLLRVATLLRSQ